VEKKEERNDPIERTVLGDLFVQLQAVERDISKEGTGEAGGVLTGGFFFDIGKAGDKRQSKKKKSSS